MNFVLQLIYYHINILNVLLSSYRKSEFFVSMKLEKKTMIICKSELLASFLCFFYFFFFFFIKTEKREGALYIINY